MPELNSANRQVCDCDIRILKTNEPFLFFDTANTTTAGLSGDSVYAMKKGTRAVAFQNPIEGTLTIEAQVVPFKMFAMLSDGIIETTGLKAVKTSVIASEDGKITIPEIENGTIKTGTLFVYADGEYGNEAIEGVLADGVFTATESSKIAKDSPYDVGYIVNKTSGVHRVSFNNKRIPRDYYITMETLEKSEDGTLTPFIMTAYKASINRDFEMSFSSEGDPISYSLSFSLLEDKDGNVFDIMEDLDEAE